MVKFLHHFAVICIVALNIQATSLLAQTPPVEDLAADLNKDQRDRLLQLILRNSASPSDESFKTVLKNLGPAQQEEIRDYILLIKSKDYQPPADVQFDQDTIDFGRVQIGNIKRARITFNVESEDPYIINPEYKSSCPHLTAELPEYPFMRGETGSITIALNTRQLVEGPLRLAISIRGNNAPNHRKIIYVKADLLSANNYAIQKP
jgi:Protein of unknown function (DUF1573)